MVEQLAYNEKVSGSSPLLPKKCGCGGIGRHTRFRLWGQLVLRVQVLPPVYTMIFSMYTMPYCARIVWYASIVPRTHCFWYCNYIVYMITPKYFTYYILASILALVRNLLNNSVELFQEEWLSGLRHWFAKSAYILCTMGSNPISSEEL